MSSIYIRIAGKVFDSSLSGGYNVKQLKIAFKVSAALSISAKTI